MTAAYIHLNGFHLRVKPAYSRLIELPRALDWLDVMYPAAIPMGAEPAASRCSELVEQVGHRVARTIVARKRGPPSALAARDEDGLALFVGEPIERLLDG